MRVVPAGAAGLLATGQVVEQVVEGELPDPFRDGPAVEEELRVDAAVRGLDHGGRLGQRGPQPGQVTGVHPVRLVEHDEVGDGHVPLDLGVVLARRLVLRRVDDLDQAPINDARVLAGEQHLEELLRFGQTARLDDDDVEAGGGTGELVEVAVEFAAVHGAAQTAASE